MRKYNVLTENCATAVDECLKTASISTQPYKDNLLINFVIGSLFPIGKLLYNFSEDRMPVLIFNNIKISNPNGKLIHKSK